MNLNHKIKTTFTARDNSGDTIIIESSGVATDIRIRVEVSKTNLGYPNIAIVRIDNLSRDTRQALSNTERAWDALIEVGFEITNEPLTRMTSGLVTASNTTGPIQGNITTTVHVRDGNFDYLTALVDRNFEPFQKINDVVEEVAGEFAEVAVEPGQIDLGNAELGSKGLVVVGRVTDVLNDLANRWGFGWSIQEDTFNAYSDLRGSGRAIDVNANANNLQNATPLLDNLTQFVVGMQITTLLLPVLRPYDTINLVSDVNPQLNGAYVITNITHILDTHGQAWQTTAQSLLVGDAYLNIFRQNPIQPPKNG